ncbi:MAG: asparagine synthase (glutamine-hydrolyzing) [Balneolaceae bacterium]
MCGIFGIIEKTGKEIDSTEMQIMHKAQFHRGPDHFGYLKNENIFLGNNRLSIIDLSNGNQPFYSADGNIAVLQNGEIFNYLELKEELVRDGVEFRTNSDTEVILKLYERFGMQMVNRLNGMFSIVILDKKKQQLFLIRDRFGLKPLFYHKGNEKFSFSSEIKSILELGVDTGLNIEAMFSFLRYNFVAGKESIFKNIFNVSPGHYLKLDTVSGELNEVKWWDQEKELDRFSSLLTSKNAIELTRETIFDAIKIRMRSDVEYSAFLSGGIDSSIIVSQMNKITDEKFNTFTIGFEGSKFDESEFANSVASQLNVNHRCESFSTNILDYWDKVLYHTEQPHGDVSFIPLFLLSRFASEKDRVVLTGDGADEIFGGYEKYLEYDNSKDFKELYTTQSTLFSDNEILDLYQNGSVLPEGSIAKIIESDPMFKSDIIKGSRNKAMYMDTVFLLPYNNLIKPDRMGMAHSIELRTPFMDYRVVSLALAINSSYKLKGEITKSILRETFKSGIPDKVYQRKKQKFIVPLDENRKNIELFYSSFKNSDLYKLGIYSDKFLKKLYLDHLNGKKNNYRKLRAIGAISNWYEIYKQYL